MEPSPRSETLPLHAIWAALGGDPALTARVTITGTGGLASAFAVSDLATGAVGAAGLALAELLGTDVTVDRRLASLWFGTTLRPQGWELPPAWDPIAGDYRAADGWIRLHTNAPHHREAALAVLGVPAEREAVAAAVRRRTADALESEVIGRGGCAATMRSLAAWRAHPQGAAVSVEPLVWIETTVSGPAPVIGTDPARPLAGLRVLDLTRVLAGPVATRFLAGHGAEVLRIDPPGWDEPGVIHDTTLGKRCARLDLRRPADRRSVEELLATADVLVHGYRPDALDRLGLDAATRQRLRPGLVDVCHDAYGWTGPWRGRRGFDSLVQMSAGIAAEGMRHYGTETPAPLPVQALDHATGYLVAAAVLRGVIRQQRDGVGTRARASLARTAAFLTALPRVGGGALEPATDADFSPEVEMTAWGPARRLRPPLSVGGAPQRWFRGAVPLGHDEPVWLPR